MRWDLCGARCNRPPVKLCSLLCSQVSSWAWPAQRTNACPAGRAATRAHQVHAGKPAAEGQETGQRNSFRSLQCSASSAVLSPYQVPAAQVVDNFAERYPAASKSWVETQLKEITVHEDRAWRVKPDVLIAHGELYFLL